MGQSTYPSPAPIATPAVTNANIQVCGQNLSRKALYVFNTSSTLTIWVTPLGLVAAVAGAGAIAIQPLQGTMFPEWTQGMNAIGSGAGPTALTILEYYP